MEVDKEKLQKLITSFFDVCGYCDELNIYEWDEAVKDMDEMKDWVEENFGRKLK